MAEEGFYLHLVIRRMLHYADIAITVKVSRSGAIVTSSHLNVLGLASYLGM